MYLKEPKSLRYKFIVVQLLLLLSRVYNSLMKSVPRAVSQSTRHNVN